MSKADDFIAENIERYGLTGTNVTPNPPKYPELKGSGILFFTDRNHFTWGYNGNTYNFRRSSSDIYFTDYFYDVKDKILPFDEALVNAAGEMHDHFGGFAVVNSGNVQSYAFADACRRARVGFVQLVVTYDGVLPYPVDGRVQTVTMNITERLMRDVADEVVPWLRTRNIGVIQDIAIARAFTDHVVFPGSLHLVNHNSVNGERVGPPNWALQDSEEDSALMRWDYFQDGPTKVMPDISRWSPELMASQLNDPLFKAWLAGTNDSNSFMAMRSMWSGASPIGPQVYAMPDWWPDVMDHIDSLHDKGKCNEKWYTPLPRLLEQFSIHMPYEIADESYGTVE